MIAAAAAPPSLDTFFAQMLSANPFTDNRAGGAVADAVDVPGVHAEAFARLTELAGEAAGNGRALGALLVSEAGVGKSHILGRLAHWAEEGGRARFVCLHNLQAGPESLPRSLLKAVVSVLTLGRGRAFAETPLFRLASAFVREACGYRDRVVSWDVVRRAYERHIDRLGAAGTGLVDRTIYEVLYEFFHSAYLEARGRPDGVAALAARWLAGDALDPSQAHRLGLPAAPGRHDPAALRDNQQVKQVLVALTRLALSRREPFLLCFDQVDNLDVEQAAALARFLEALLDGATNLLVVTAGVQATLHHWRETKVIQDSAWDRLAQFEVPLRRVDASAAERLVAARLTRFLAPYRDISEMERLTSVDPLFPLGRSWRAEVLDGKADLRPRDVLSRAREGWRRRQEALRVQGGPMWLNSWDTSPPPLPHGRDPIPPIDVHRVLDDLVERRAAEHQAKRVAQPQTLPWDADHLAGLTVALLEGWRQAEPACGVVRAERVAAPASGKRPVYDVAVRLRHDGGEATTGILFLATGNATSTAGFLRRLVQTVRVPKRLIVVTDAREPLVLGPKGQEYVKQLRRKAASLFRHLELPFADYARLDALQAVVGQARSGDLEIDVGEKEPRRVAEIEVTASHVRAGRYRAAPLLRELMAVAKAD